jgi:hypothetical protein
MQESGIPSGRAEVKKKMSNTNLAAFVAEVHPPADQENLNFTKKKKKKKKKKK